MEPENNVTEVKSESVFERWLATDIKRQRSARIGTWFFRITLLVLLCALVVAVFSLGSGSSNDSYQHKHIALLRLSGQIGANQPIKARRVVPLLEKIFKNVNVKGVIVALNSRGGSPVQSDLIYHTMMRLRKEHPKKKVYTVISDYGASGGYYIAAASNKIYVNPNSIIGSIGVVSQNFDFSEAIKRLGIKNRTFTAGRNKHLSDPFKPMTKEGKEIMRTMLDDMHTNFIDAVRKGRGSRLKVTPQTFSGAYWSGRRAVKMGLADGIGTVRSVAAKIDKTLKVVDYSPAEPYLKSLVGELGAQIGIEVRETLEGSLR